MKTDLKELKAMISLTTLLLLFVACSERLEHCDAYGNGTGNGTVQASSQGHINNEYCHQTFRK